MMNVRCFNSFLHSFKRLPHFDKKYMSTLKNISVEKLEKRQLLKLSGPDVMKYLQGMISNDVQIFGEKVQSCVAGSCIYTLLLNVQGRVLYDCLVYKLQNDDCYLEYDSAATLYIQKHLNIYKLKKEVTIQPFEDFSVSVAYFPNNTNEFYKNHEFQRVIDSVSGNEHKILAFRDPRIKELGFRLLSDKGLNMKDILEHSESYSKTISYDLHRYKLGVGEGVLDHPPGNCLPFETNADFLNGVSFQKGCYIGQELTARVHFTGVVRKRIMPVILSSENEHYPKFPVECIIINEDGQNMGRFRNHKGKYGLALLKVEECLKAKVLKLKGYDINILVVKPNWWPSDTYKIKHRMQ